MIIVMDAKELIERTATELTDGRSEIVMHEDETGAVFEIFSTENALLIGRNRATINSIRTLAKALGINGKHRIKVVLRERKKEA